MKNPRKPKPRKTSSRGRIYKAKPLPPSEESVGEKKKQLAPSEVTVEIKQINATTQEMRMTRQPERPIPMSMSIELEGEPHPHRPVTIGDMISGRAEVRDRQAEEQRFPQPPGCERKQVVYVPQLETKSHQQTHKVPKNHWERVKLKVFPAWAKRAWPVLYVEVPIK